MERIISALILIFVLTSCGSSKKSLVKSESINDTITIRDTIRIRTNDSSALRENRILRQRLIQSRDSIRENITPDGSITRTYYGEKTQSNLTDSISILNERIASLTAENSSLIQSNISKDSNIQIREKTIHSTFWRVVALSELGIILILGLFLYFRH